MKLTEFIFWLYLAINSVSLVAYLIFLIKKAIDRSYMKHDFEYRILNRLEEIEMTLNENADKKL